MKTVNELNDLWITEGNMVTDLNERITVALADDNFSAEDLSELKIKRDEAKIKRDTYLEQKVEAQALEVANMSEGDKKPLSEAENELKDTFVKDFVEMVANPIAYQVRRAENSVSSATGDGTPNAGLTIPKDIQTMINTLKRQYEPLEGLVKRETVTTPTGSRVFEKFTEITGLTSLDTEDGIIPNIDNPNLTTISYLIKRYAGIATLTNTLLKDTAENIIGWLTDWIAKKVVKTRNDAIVAKFQASPAIAERKKFDDIITMINTAVDPAIKASSILITNTSGFDVLSRVKTAEGEYLITPSVTSPDTYLLRGKTIKVYADRTLPSAGTAQTPIFPIFYGDPAQAVTLFDREHMSIETTNIGAGAFETDTFKIRVIDRFDVEATDSGALIYAPFKAIADQEGTFKTVAG